MIENQLLFTKYYSICYSDISTLKIMQRQSMLQSKLQGVQAQVRHKIISVMPQLLSSLPYYSNSQLRQLESVAADFRNKFETIIVVAMGGGLLNSIAIYDFIGDNSSCKIIFLHETCDYYLSHIKNTINLEKTGFIFISNSGDSIETVTIAEYWYDLLSSNHIQDLSQRFIFIYGAKSGSLLQKLHENAGGVFLQYDRSMGGRFSTFTTPHLLVATLLGVDIKELFAGANDILNSLNSDNQPEEKAINSAALITACGTGKFTSTSSIALIGSYDSRLRGLTQWYHTALAETLGKESINIFPVNINLPLDQHGLMQAILTNEAPHQILHLFSVRDYSEAKIQTTQKMLKEEVKTQCSKANIPVREFILNEYSAKSLGATIMSLILELITTAVLLEVEPFDQPQIDAIKCNLTLQYKKFFQQGVP